MKPLLQRRVGAYTATIAHSTRADGDLAPTRFPPERLGRRRNDMVAGRWHAVRQVHSDRVLVAAADDGDQALAVGDALITETPGHVVAAHAGDCVPVGMIASSDGRVAVAAAHAGWGGLERGVLESTVRALRSIVGPVGEIVAAVGPHIRAERYEFGRTDLARLARRFGPSVVSTTQDGAPALDLTEAVARELDRLETQALVWSHECTARDADHYWSHRARRESGRIALVAWLEPPAEHAQGGSR